MSESTSQLKIGAALDGSFETATSTAKRKIGELGTAATDTGKSLAGMGNGTAASAQKVEQATKSMIQSIQRTTAATEAGDKSTRAYQESLARMRGIDVAALKPYLDQLDAAKSKASLAATANASYASSFSGIKTAALAAGAAIAAFGLFAKKINDGVDALNDLKDATGSSIENISALQDIAARTGTSFDTVGAAMIKFNKTLGDAKPGTDAVRVLEQLGLNAKELKNIDPAEALLKTAKAFEKFADDGNKARAMEELFGKSTKEVAAYLKDLAEKSELVGTVTTQAAQEAEKFNKELFKLEKNALDLARSLTSSLIPALNQVFEDFRNFGPKMDLGSAASEVVRLNKELKGLKEIEVGKFNIFGGVTKQIEQVSKDLDAAKAKFNALDTARPNAAGDAANAAYEALEQRRLANRPTIKVPEKVDPAIAAAAKKAVADYNKELEDQAKLLAELSGLTGSFAGDWDRLSAIYKKGGLSLDGLVKAQADLLAKQPAIKAATDAEAKSKEILAKANLAAAESHLKYITSIDAGVDKIKADIASQVEATERMGLTKEAVANLDAAKLEMLATDLDLQAIKALDRNLDEQTYNALKKQAQGYRDLAQAKQAGAARETVVNAAKEAADEWKKTSDSIQNTLTDALMRGFESGKDFARNLRDTVVNMFKTLVLRPIISAVINPIAGALTGALGLSGAAQAAGTGSSVLSSVGTIAGLASTFGAGLKAGFAGLMGEAGLMGTLSAGTTALGAGNIAGGLGTLGGPLALATAAILGLSAIIKATSGETRNGAKYGLGSDGKAVKLEGPSGGEIAATQAQAMFNVAKSSIEGLLTGLGSKAVLTGFTAGLESSENGKGFAYATGAINGKSFGDVNTYMNSRGDKTQEQALKDYQLELTQSILEGLQVTEDIPASIAKLISDGLNGSEVKNLSLEATSAILANVETLSKQVATFGAAMTQLPFESLTKLSFDTTAGLIAAAGGFEKLDANLTSYYANFYSAEEQRAQSITNTEAAFKALGLTMPALDEGARAAYRSMVELAAGQDLSVEANAKAYTGLLSLNGAMNSLAPAIDSVAQSASEAAATMTSAWASVMTSRGQNSSAYTAQAAIDAAFAQYKKTDKLGIANAAQFQTITQADFASYSSDNQKLIATILGGFAELTKANTPAVEAAQTYTQDTYAAPDTSIADAIAEITKGLTDAGASLGVELLKAQGKTVEAAAAQRTIETAGYNTAQVALYDYNQTLRDQITALGEATALQARIAAERTGLQEQYDTLTMTSAELLTKQRSALEESNRALFDGINAIKAETVAKDAATKAAKDAIDAAIKSTAAAVAAGDVTRNAAAKGGTDAMSAVQRAVDAQKKIIQVARDVAAESVSSLSSIFDTIQSSVKELYGTVDSTARMQADQGRAFIKQSLATAQSTGYMPDGKALTDAINAAKGDTRQYTSQADKDFAALSLAGDLSLLGEVGKDQLTAAEQALKMQDDQLAALESTLTLAQQQLDAANGINTSVLSIADALALLATAITSIKSAPPVGGTVGLNAGAGSDIKTVQDLYSVNLGRTADASGLAFWTNAFMGDGVISAEERQQFAISAMPEFRALRGYAVGTNFVPADGPAYLHQGEAVIPRAYNPAAGGNTSARLESLVEGLTKEVQRLQSIVNDGNKSNQRIAETLDNVTEGGSNMRTVAS